MGSTTAIVFCLSSWLSTAFTNAYWMARIFHTTFLGYAGFAPLSFLGNLGKDLHVECASFVFGFVFNFDGLRLYRWDFWLETPNANEATSGCIVR